MNIKRILAAASASIVAVSAMAVVASAQDVKITWTIDGNPSWGATPAGNTIIFQEEGWLDGIDISLIYTVEVDIETPTDCCKGIIGGNINGDWKTSDVYETSGDETWTFDVDGNLSDAESLQVQIWWLNCLWSDELQGPGDGSATMTAYRLLDKDGNEVKEGQVAKTVDFKSDDTNIEVSAPADAFADGTKFSATVIADQTTDTQFAFDLKFTKDDKEVQPAKAVTVKIPVPEKIKDAKDIFVFHVEDGKNVKVDCKVENGMVVFSASKFSTFIVTSENLNADKEEESKPEESKPTESKVLPNWKRPVPAIGEGPADQRPVPGGSTTTPGTSTPGTTTPGTSDPGTTNPSNPTTGVAIAFAPALLAGAAVVVAKKRK